MASKTDFNAVRKTLIQLKHLSHQTNKAKKVQQVYFEENKKIYIGWAGHIVISLLNFEVEKFKLLAQNRPVLAENVT